MNRFSPIIQEQINFFIWQIGIKIVNLQHSKLLILRRMGIAETPPNIRLNRSRLTYMEFTQSLNFVPTGTFPARLDEAYIKLDRNQIKIQYHCQYDIIGGCYGDYLLTV